MVDADKMDGFTAFLCDGDPPATFKGTLAEALALGSDWPGDVSLAEISKWVEIKTDSAAGRRDVMVDINAAYDAFVRRGSGATAQRDTSALPTTSPVPPDLRHAAGPAVPGLPSSAFDPIPWRDAGATVDDITAPTHYIGANGIESVDVIEAFGHDTNHARASAIEYLLRAGRKGDQAQAIRDLQKAARWIGREINRLETGEAKW